MILTGHERGKAYGVRRQRDVAPFSGYDLLQNGAGARLRARM